MWSWNGSVSSRTSFITFYAPLPIKANSYQEEIEKTKADDAIIKKIEADDAYYIVQLLFLFEGNLGYNEIINMDLPTLKSLQDGRHKHIVEILKERKREEELARVNMK